MRTLADEYFAPITSSIGFLELPLEQTAEAMTEWLRSLHPCVEVTKTSEGFPSVLHRLEPLTLAANPRQLLVRVGPSWTAYFDCGLRGTDPIGPIGHLSQTLMCQGLAITADPRTVGLRGIAKGRTGAVKFELFGPLKTDFLNYVRTIVLVHDGSRWIFEASGTVQAFEEVPAYSARRVRERFTSEMLERYCAAMGLNVFDANSYGPEAVLFESEVVMPPSPIIMDLKSAQEWLEITPGMADGIPG